MSADVDNPYVGPRTFEEEDARYFFGREREARELLSLVITGPLVLFHAQSGAGKSSLINTRLIPSLRQEGFTVLPVGRVGGALPEGMAEVSNVFVFNLLLSLDQGQRAATDLAHLTLADYLQAREDQLAATEGEEGWASAKGISRVLIVDQFEEIVTTHLAHWPEREAFFQQLNEAIRADDHLWVVLSLREDYAAALDPYARLLTGRMRTRFHMQRMEAATALEAVKEPAAAAGQPFVPGVAEDLIDNLRQIRVQDGSGVTHLGQFIEPVQLQVVCYQLWQQLRDRPLGPITQRDVDELGNVDSALAQFYEQAVATVLSQTKVAEPALRNWFERQLITEAGTRGTVYQGKMETAGLDNQVVQLLANQFLLRAEIRAGGTWYELVHDRFVGPILQANQAWRLAQSPLMRAAEAWDQAGRSRDKLYQGQQLKEAAASVNRETAIPLVQQFLAASEAAQSQQELAAMQAQAAEQTARAEAEARRARRLRTLSYALVLMVLLGLVAATFATSANVRASRSQATAESASGLAVAQQGTAVAASTLAISQQVAAEAASTRAIEQRVAAEDASTRAIEEQATAEIASTRAIEQQLTAEAARATAIVEQSTAEAASALALAEQQNAEQALRDAEANRRLQVAQSLAFYTLEALQDDHDTELALLLALEAYRINEVQAGNLAATIDRALLPLLSESYFNTVLGSHAGAVRDLAFMPPDGRTIVSIGADGLIRLWPVDNPGAAPGEIDATNDAVDFMALAEDSRTVVAASAAGAIRVWGLEDPSAAPFTLTVDDSISALAISPDGRLVALAIGAGYVLLWTPYEPGAEPVILEGFDTRGFVSLVFSADGGTLTACCSLNLTWRISNLSASGASTGAPVAPRLATLPDGQGGIFVHDEHSVSITLLNRPVSFTYTPENNARFLALSLSPDGSILATAWDDGLIRLLRLGALDPLTTAGTYPLDRPAFAHLNHQATALRFSPDGQFLASAGEDGAIRLWRPNTFILDNSAHYFALAPDGSLVSAGPNRLVELRSLADILAGGVDSSAVFSGMANDIRAIAIAPDGQTIAAGDGRRQAAGAIYIWRRDGPEATPISLTGHQRAVNSIAFSPDGQLLVSGSGDGLDARRDNTIRLWRINDPGASPTILGETPTEVTLVAFAPDGETVVSGEMDGTIRLWPLDGAVEPVVLAGHTERVAAVAFSPDGSLMASASGDRSIRLWDWRGNTQPRTLLGHDAGVTAVFFSPDGRTLASAGADNTIRLWALDDLDTRPAILAGHTGPVTAVAFSQDGNYLVSAGPDSIRLWPTRPQLVATACQKVRRNLTWAEWQSYIGDEPYRQTCPNLPAHYTVPQQP